MLFVIIAISVVLVVLLTAVLKLHPFLSLLIGAFFMGIASGMPLADVVLSVNEGFGGLMTSIGIVIVAGTIIGVILEKSGAAYRMAEVVLRLIGEKRPQLAMSIIGFIVSIPVFLRFWIHHFIKLEKSLGETCESVDRFHVSSACHRFVCDAYIGAAYTWDDCSCRQHRC